MPDTSVIMSRGHSAIFIFVAVILKCILFCHGWGSDGHRMICAIAQPLLSDQALESVRSLLPPSAEGLLPRVCTWADDVKHTAGYSWSAPLHYVDTPDFACNYNYLRDCHYRESATGDCAAGAINNYTSQLESVTLDRKGTQLLPNNNYNLTEALMFLSHIVGDIHQPLHVGFIGDLGGNTIKVEWFGRKHNLHEVWDTEILKHGISIKYRSSAVAMVDALASRIATDWLPDATEWATCPSSLTACPDTYAAESVTTACRWAYRNATPGTNLQDDYFESRLPIVEELLAKAGVRLAAILNRIFTSSAHVY